VRRRRRLRLLAALVVVCVLGVAAALTVQHYTHRSGKPQAKQSSSPTVRLVGATLADPAAASAYLAAAASDVTVVSSYDYRDLDSALNAGLAVTTGSYQAAFRAALTGSLAAAARQARAVHTFEVQQIGIGAMTSHQATVLVFGRQTVVDDTTGPGGSTSPVSLTVTLVRDGAQYLISELVSGADPGLPAAGPELDTAAAAARAALVDALQKTGTGLTATVTAQAVANAAATTVTMLLLAQVTRGSGSPTAAPARYAVTVNRTDTGWVATQLTNVDASG